MGFSGLIRSCCGRKKLDGTGYDTVSGRLSLDFTIGDTVIAERLEGSQLMTV